MDNAYKSASSESNSDKRQQLEQQAEISANGALKTISSNEITENFLGRLKQFHNVTLVVKDDRELTSGAFLLNRFIAAQLIKCGLIEVLHHGSADDVTPIKEALQKLLRSLFRDPLRGFAHLGLLATLLQSFLKRKKYTVKAGGATKDVDDVLVREGHEVPEETKSRQAKFKNGLKEFQSQSRGISLSIARLPPSKLPTDKEWVLFSDLYDSTTQAEVFDFLKLKEGYTHEDAEKDLLILYARRLMFDIVRRQKIIIVDTQLLDGAFFLRWIPQLAKDAATNAALLKLLKERVIFRYRGESIPKCLESYFFQSGYRLKQFEFSAISDKGIRKEIAGWFEKQSKDVTSYPTIEDIAKDSEFKPCWKKEWQGLRDRQNDLLQALKQLQDRQLLTFEPTKGPWDQFSAVEDPALFSLSIEDADAELLRGMYCKKLGTEQTPTRSDFYRHVEDRFDNKEQYGKDYFDRSYNRTMARQHGATVFETIRVNESANSTDPGEKSDKGLWKFNRRDGEERVPKVIEIENSDLTPDKLQELFNGNVSARNNPYLFKLKIMVPALTATFRRWEGGRSRCCADRVLIHGGCGWRRHQR
ncbi:MAG: hypothetical protein ACRD9S_23390 [Pyrinomonadaceae bacterium]